MGAGEADLSRGVPATDAVQRRDTPAANGPPVTMDYVTTAIVVTVLALVGLGIVINELLRLRTWLKNSPTPPPEGEDADPPGG